VASLAGCKTSIEDMDEIFYDWTDRQILCAANIDDHAGNDLDTIFAGLERARDTGEVLQLYGHEPGDLAMGATVTIEKVEAILARTAELGLPFYRSPDLGPGGARTGGLALSFDDAHVDDWWALRDTFDRYGAKVTFFVTRYGGWDDEMKAKLRDLRSDGHSVQAHSVNHLRAPEYVTEYGLAAYVEDEALPSIDALVADGYPVIDYAYPFGARTGELDRALLEHVQRLRSVSFPVDNTLVVDPCPE
jgi:peptidoglycan/xylan/chitin deacetylase (PgdA/CDA1 family)